MHQSWRSGGAVAESGELSSERNLFFFQLRSGFHQLLVLGLQDGKPPCFLPPLLRDGLGGGLGGGLFLPGRVEMNFGYV